MPAKITVQSGISAGSSHWIEQKVVRVGSDPTADICLPSADVPKHALTLEYNNGDYRVYNRCRQNLFVGTHVVAPNAVAAWSDTDILQFGNGIELVLDIEEDPTPREQSPTFNAFLDEDKEVGSGAPSGVQTDDPSNSDMAISATPAGFKTWIQLGVTVACLVMGVLLLTRHRLQGSSAAANRPTFSEVIKEALDSPSTAKPLVGRLQYAESALVRGDKQAARERFELLRDDLLVQKNEFIADQRGAELTIMDFVELRLSQLE